MANLFPDNILENPLIEEEEEFVQKRSYAIDFDTMTYKKNVDGTVRLLDEQESYLQWCQLAMMTCRMSYMAYDERFGRDIVGSNADRNVVELEIKRVTQEALLVHPLTKSVDDFEYEWKNNEVFFSYTVISKYGQCRLKNEKELG